jgi:dTDP-4-amino-4,6-dideoxygalactose transaminase
VATANAVRFLGAVPVFVDVEAATLNLDPRGLAAAVGPKTRAILVVHQLGLPADLRAVLGFAAEKGLPVVEDAACAIGSELDLGRGFERIGRPHGDVAVFSFHPRKILTTGDGGLLVTARADWDAGFRRGRNIGGLGQELGRNFRLTDLQAAVGRAQLKKLPAMLARRREQVARYREKLAGVVGFPEEPSWARTNWQSLCVRVADPEKVGQALTARGIATRGGIACAHRLPVYAKEPWRAAGPLVESERAEREGLMLPLYHELRDEEIDRIAAAVRGAL